MVRKKKDSDNDSAPKGFPKKWLKKLPENWTETAEGYDNDTLKKEVIKLEHAISATEKDQEADADLTALKEQVKEAAEVYTKSITECQAMVRYSIFLLQSRGQG